MNNFADATFRFMQAIDFHLHESCSGHEPNDPLCPFVNMSAHFLSCILIENTLNAHVEKINDFEKYLSAIRKLKGHEQRDDKLDIKDEGEITIELLIECFVDTTEDLCKVVEEQQLFRTKGEILFKSGQEDFVTCLTELNSAANKVVESNDQNNNLWENNLREMLVLVSNFIGDFRYFLKKLREHRRDKECLSTKIIRYHKWHLGELSFRGTNKINFVRKLCTDLYDAARKSDIWGPKSLDTLCCSGQMQHSICKHDEGVD